VGNISLITIQRFAENFKQRWERHEKEEALLKEPIDKEWVSYPEAERYSGLSHTTLWRKVTSGELRAARIGRSMRLHFPSLRQFMETHATQPRLPGFDEFEWLAVAPVRKEVLARPSTTKEIS
jgi:excisionase family DNA binding protein